MLESHSKQRSLLEGLVSFETKERVESMFSALGRMTRNKGACLKVWSHLKQRSVLKVCFRHWTE